METCSAVQKKDLWLELHNLDQLVQPGEQTAGPLHLRHGHNLGQQAPFHQYWPHVHHIPRPCRHTFVLDWQEQQLALRSRRLEHHIQRPFLRIADHLEYQVAAPAFQIGIQHFHIHKLLVLPAGHAQPLAVQPEGQPAALAFQTETRRCHTYWHLARYANHPYPPSQQVELRLGTAPAAAYRQPHGKQPLVAGKTQLRNLGHVCCTGCMALHP